jgi:HEAT repeat protein
MGQKKTCSFIVVLTFFIAIAANLSFAVASLTEGNDSDMVSDVKRILTEIAAYDYGQKRESLSALRELVKASLDSPDLIPQIEKEMILFLKSDATFAGKQFICEQLSIMGSEASVPTFAEMLSDKKSCDIALYALQRIPDPSVDIALRNALSKSEHKAKIGIINSLGERQDGNAVAQLDQLVYHEDPQIALSAATALGKIADNSAMEALKKARLKTRGELHLRLIDAYLRCADNLLDAGNTSQAASVYRDIYENEELTPIRAAALCGLVRTNKEGASDIILAALKKDNRDLQSVAIGLIRELPPSADLTKIIIECPNLSSQGQIQLLAAFAHRQETAAHQAVLDAVKHYDEAVRIAALQALAGIGDESDIPLLLKVATEVSGMDREAARGSLDLLRGASVNQLIMELIPTADPHVKAELVRSLGQRNVVEATDPLLKTAVDTDPTVRRESFKSLAIVSSPEFIDKLIQLVIEEKNSGVRDEAERTLVLVSQKIQDPSNQARAVLEVLSSVEDIEARRSLLEVAGRIGDKNALPVIKNELKNENLENQKAAIYALSAWPDAQPIDDLINVVKSSDNEALKILALRGYIDLLKIRSERPAKESIALLMTAMDLATEASEKKMVLSGLGRLRSVETLEISARYLDDPAIKLEAEAALIRPLELLFESDENSLKEMLNEGLRETLNKILSSTDDDRIREWVIEILERGKETV